MVHGHMFMGTIIFWGGEYLESYGTPGITLL